METTSLGAKKQKFNNTSFCLYCAQRTPAGQQSNSNKNDHNRTLYNVLSISSSSLFGKTTLAAQTASESGFIFPSENKFDNRCTARHHQCPHGQAAHRTCHKYFCPRITKKRRSRSWMKSNKNDYTVVFFFFLLSFTENFSFDFWPYVESPIHNATPVDVESMINDWKRAVFFCRGSRTIGT